MTGNLHSHAGRTQVHKKHFISFFFCTYSLLLWVRQHWAHLNICLHAWEDRPTLLPCFRQHWAPLNICLHAWENKPTLLPRQHWAPLNICLHAWENKPTLLLCFRQHWYIGHLCTYVYMLEKIGLLCCSAAKPFSKQNTITQFKLFLCPLFSIIYHMRKIRCEHPLACSSTNKWMQNIVGARHRCACIFWHSRQVEIHIYTFLTFRLLWLKDSVKTLATIFKTFF